MGAHIALYACTQTDYTFYGIILHNCAILPTKKHKLTKEKMKELNAYLPEGNLDF